MKLSACQCGGFHLVADRSSTGSCPAPRLSPYVVRARRGRVDFEPARPRDLAATASLCTLLALAGVVAGQAMRDAHEPPAPVVAVEPAVEPVRAVVELPEAPKAKRARSARQEARQP